MSEKLKVLHISSSDQEGGAARAAYRFHQGLRQAGIDSRMLVQSKSSDDTFVMGSKSKVGKGFALARPFLDTLPLQFYGDRQKTNFSTAWIPSNIVGRVSAINPDIIHLHWVGGGFLKLETLCRFQQPLVWTLHDMWAFTGGCHYDSGCGRYVEFCGNCPVLGSKSGNDLSFRIWKRKKAAWVDLDLTIVAPSKWLADCAYRSSLLRAFRVEVIHNGIDLNLYKPVNMAFAREVLSLPKGKKLILFGAMSATSDERKGFDHLKSALEVLTADASGDYELVIFGATAPEPSPNLGMPCHYIGALSDDVSLALLYSAVDVFVAPSKQENLANTVVEALACGTPTVAFDIGGMPDMIEHKTNGYLARPFVAADLAAGISWVLADGQRRSALRVRAREKAESAFCVVAQARRYGDLYSQLIDRKNGRNLNGRDVSSSGT